MNAWVPILVSVILAIIPVIIWLRIIHREGEEKSLYIKTFLLGTFSVVPPILIHFILFEKYPQLNVYSIITNTVEQVALAALLTNVIVGIIEELAKNVIVRVIDKRHPEYIQTLSAALKLSICAGLGFAFAENIFYFYTVWTNPEFTYADVFSTFIFRSIITMCGHMVFSGIFGYFFGIGKFAADITEQAKWEGSKLRFARLLSRMTGRMTFEIIREQKNLTGLFLAMGIHATFNAFLDLGHNLVAVLIIISAALYTAYLLNTKSGHLLFSIIKRRASSMAGKDEDVVLELLGMWLKEGKLKEVIEICDRLLARDPDNNVVKLFRAKALDDQGLKQVYSSLKAVFEKQKKAAAAPLAPGQSDATAPTLDIKDEKVVLEFMDMWFKKGDYKKVLDIANRLMERNPGSSGAQVLIEKALDKEKLQNVFDSLSRLFKPGEGGS